VTFAAPGWGILKAAILDFRHFGKKDRETWGEQARFLRSMADKGMEEEKAMFIFLFKFNPHFFVM
jgi:hypothetical protein